MCEGGRTGCAWLSACAARARARSCLVLDLLGDSLESLFNKCNRKFTLKTTLMLGIQMVCRRRRRLAARFPRPPSAPAALR